MRRAAALLTTAALLATSAIASSPAAANASCASRNLEFIYLETFKVELTKAPKGQFEPGDTVKFPLTVTRPAERDPLGQGISTPRPVVEPAPEVPVVIVAFADDVLLIDYKLTDQDGKVNLALKLPSYMPSGTVSARIYAQKLLQDTNCITIYEVGELTLGAAFEVR